MSPAPSMFHQNISMNLSYEMKRFFRNQKCKVFHAPFDVRLLNKQKSTPDNQVFTVVQPDLCVICDVTKLDERGCSGSPDLVVEILSPGNTNKEMKNKFALYQEATISEYWLIEPYDRTVLVYVLREGIYMGLQPFTDEDVLISQAFPDLKIEVATLFE
jgi:Uma2 family endonuclease